MHGQIKHAGRAQEWSAAGHLLGQVLQCLGVNHSIHLAQPMLDDLADPGSTVRWELHGLVLLQTQPFEVRPVTTADSNEYEP